MLFLLLLTFNLAIYVHGNFDQNGLRWPSTMLARKKMDNIWLLALLFQVFGPTLPHILPWHLSHEAI